MSHCSSVDRRFQLLPGHDAPQAELGNLLLQGHLDEHQVGFDVLDGKDVKHRFRRRVALRGPVDRQPVDAEAGNRFDEIRGVDGLADKAVGAVLVALQAIPLLVRRGEKDDGQVLRARPRPDTVQDLQPADPRQVDVQEHDRGQVRPFAVRELAFAEDVVQRLLAVAHHVDAVGKVDLLQGPQGQHLVLAVVLHQQDHPGCHQACSPRLNVKAAPFPGAPVALIVPP